MTLDDMIEAAMPAVERVVRNRFRTSLAASDSRQDSERARDCMQETLLLLVEKFQRVLAEADPPIDSIPDYAARVAHNTVNDEMRTNAPDRARLKNRLRHVLNEHASFDAWTDRDGAFVAGYAGWKTIRPARASASDVARRGDELRADGMLAVHWENMGKAEWSALLTRVFDLGSGPMEVDELIGCLADLLGVVLQPGSSLDETYDGESADRDARLADPELSPEDAAMQNDDLRRLWRCIRGLRREWLFAFLLNPPSLSEQRGRDKNAGPHRGTVRGEIDVLPANGIASIAEIGGLIALTPDQLARLSAESFYGIWRRLPLKDKEIGDLLGKTGGQVIGLRVQAVKQLAGCMGVLVRPKDAGHKGTARSSASDKGAR